MNNSDKTIDFEEQNKILQDHIKVYRSSLIWYQQEILALKKNYESKGGQDIERVLASLTVLSLDGGNRAAIALLQDQQ